MKKRELEIAAVAAAIAAGCIRCLQYHKKLALNIGLTENELLEIAQLAFMVRNKADEFNRGELDLILTNEKLQEESNEEPQSIAGPSSSPCCN